MSVPAAFLTIILIWSTTPLGIKWSSAGVGYEFGVAARMTIGLIAFAHCGSSVAPCYATQ